MRKYLFIEYSMKFSNSEQYLLALHEMTQLTYN